MSDVVRKVYTLILSMLYPNSDIDSLLELVYKKELFHTNIYTIKTKGIVVNGASLMDYSDKYVQKLIHILKYTGDDRVVDLLARYLNGYLLEAMSNIKTVHPGRDILIIPMPLSKKRYNHRGYNQVNLLLDKISKDSKDLSCFITSKTLLKHKDTKSQTLLNRRERLSNIKGAFSVTNAHNVKDSHVFIIDDVLTTGATATEAVNVLLKAGAAKIDVITIAKTF